MRAAAPLPRVARCVVREDCRRCRGATCGGSSTFRPARFCAMNAQRRSRRVSRQEILAASRCRGCTQSRDLARPKGNPRIGTSCRALPRLAGSFGCVAETQQTGGTSPRNLHSLPSRRGLAFPSSLPARPANFAAGRRSGRFALQAVFRGGTVRVAAIRSATFDLYRAAVGRLANSRALFGHQLLSHSSSGRVRSVTERGATPWEAACPIPEPP